MTDVLDLIDRFHAVLETDTSIVHDTSGVEPDAYRPNTFYVFPDGDQPLTGVESGPPGQQNFAIRAVFVASAPGEEAAQSRSDAVTALLSSKRDTYLAILAGIQSCDLWEQAAGEADMDWLSNFEGRAVAIRISGYRFVTE